MKGLEEVSSKNRRLYQNLENVDGGGPSPRFLIELGANNLPQDPHKTHLHIKISTISRQPLH